MKIILALALALLMLLPLAGCSQPPVQEHLDWQTVNSPTWGALSEQGYYYFYGTILHCADLKTGQSVALCSLPGCSHLDDQCDAYISTLRSNTAFFTNDRLYYYIDGEVHSRSAIGTEEKRVGVLCKKYMEEGCEVNSIKLMPAGNWLYYYHLISKNDESGKKLSQLMILGRMDLTTGEDMVFAEQILEDGTVHGMLSPGAVREDGILYLQCDGVQADREDADFQEKSESVTVRLQCWDAATGEVTTLLEKPRGEMVEICMVYAGKLYYRGAASVDSKYLLNAYDLKTGAVETVAGMEAISKWLGGPYVTIVGNRLVNLETGEFLPNEVKSIPVVARSASGFVIFDSVPYKEDPNKTEFFEYYYIPVSAMADGLQLTDMTLLWTEELHPSS